MTWQKKYRENKRFIERYDTYLAEAELSIDSRLKLIAEIARLFNQNKQIEQMTVTQYHEDTRGYTIQLNGWNYAEYQAIS